MMVAPWGAAQGGLPRWAASNASGEDKTQAPTPHRLQEARKKGQHWKSPDATTVLALLAALVGLPRYVRWVLPTLESGMQSIWMIAGTPAAWNHAVVLVGLLLLHVIAPAVVGLMLFGLLSQFALRGFQFSFQLRMQNPLANVTHWLSLMMLWNLAKGLGKVFMMLAAAGLVLWSEHAAFLQLVYLPLGALFGRAWDLIAPALWAALGVFVVWAGIDVVVQQRQFAQSLRMSHHEVKEERKNQEGNLQMRGRQRAIHRQLLRHSLKAVEHATVVLTNPTHAAVALEWHEHDTIAPRVIAKGWDATAAAIRELAAIHRIPVIANPPLARALMAVPLDQPVPVEFWREVSMVLIFLIRRRRAAEQVLTTPPSRPVAPF